MCVISFVYHIFWVYPVFHSVKSGDKDRVYDIVIVDIEVFVTYGKEVLKALVGAVGVHVHEIQYNMILQLADSSAVSVSDVAAIAEYNVSPARSVITAFKILVAFFYFRQHLCGKIVACHGKTVDLFSQTEIRNVSVPVTAEDISVEKVSEGIQRAVSVGVEICYPSEISVVAFEYLGIARIVGSDYDIALMGAEVMLIPIYGRAESGFYCGSCIGCKLCEGIGERRVRVDVFLVII